MTRIELTYQQYTDWFPPQITPVRVGYYQRDWGDPDGLNKELDYWDGRCWILCNHNGEAMRPGLKRLPWRGLREPA